MGHLVSKAAVPDALFSVGVQKSSKSSDLKSISVGDLNLQNRTLHMCLAKGLPFDLTCVNTSQTCACTKRLLARGSRGATLRYVSSICLVIMPLLIMTFWNLFMSIAEWL